METQTQLKLEENKKLFEKQTKEFAKNLDVFVCVVQ